MEEETVKILFSAPALSLLLYENSRTKEEQEGFLLGEVIETRTQTNTDTNQMRTKVERLVRVNSVVPCPHLMYFYDHCGKIDWELLKAFLGEAFPKVVSWYKFKRVDRADSMLLLRERLIHKQLSDRMKKSDTFSCCLLKEDRSDNCSTYGYNQYFVRYRNRKYDTIPIHVENLSDANDRYVKPQAVGPDFKKFLDSLKLDLSKTADNEASIKIQKGLQKKIKNSLKTLTKSEAALGEAEREVRELRERLRVHRENKQKREQLREWNESNGNVQVGDLVKLQDEDSSIEEIQEEEEASSSSGLNVIRNELRPSAPPVPEVAAAASATSPKQYETKRNTKVNNVATGEVSPQPPRNLRKVQNNKTPNAAQNRNKNNNNNANNNSKVNN